MTIFSKLLFSVSGAAVFNLALDTFLGYLYLKEQTLDVRFVVAIDVNIKSADQMVLASRCLCVLKIRTE